MQKFRQTGVHDQAVRRLLIAVGEVLVCVGAATGVIGTCTGIFDAVMGVIAYRRAGALKSIDLRLELRRLDVDLQHVIAELPIPLGNAKNSREAINSAKGIFKSSPDCGRPKDSTKSVINNKNKSERHHFLPEILRHRQY